jgi:hypothetical protein
VREIKTALTVGPKLFRLFFVEKKDLEFILSLADINSS